MVMFLGFFDPNRSSLSLEIRFLKLQILHPSSYGQDYKLLWRAFLKRCSYAKRCGQKITSCKKNAVLKNN